MTDSSTVSIDYFYTEGVDLYAENILDHYKHPRGKTPVDGATVEHHEINLSCGDELTVSLKLEDGRIKALGWDGSGCAISQAGMSLLFEELEEKTAAEAAAMTKDDIYGLLGVPVGPRRFKCALLGLHTVKNALRKAEGKEPQGWLDTVELTED